MEDTATVLYLKNQKNEIIRYQAPIVINLYNDAFNRMNKYFRYKDNKFIPEKSNPEIKKMLDDAENSLSQSEKLLNEIQDAATNKEALGKLKSSISDLKIKIKQEQVFLQQYFKQESLINVV